jgi:glucose-6-phosphate 1-dehydrogenase
LKNWAEHQPPALPNYPAGSWGPEEADKMLTESGRSWWNR